MSGGYWGTGTGVLKLGPKPINKFLTGEGRAVCAYVTYATFNLNSSLRRPQRKLWQKFSRMHMRRKSEVRPNEMPMKCLRIARCSMNWHNSQLIQSAGAPESNVLSPGQSLPVL